MAQLKDTLITGSLRVTDTIYTNITLLSILHAPTTSSGGSIGAGTAGNILFSNGTTASYWGATTGITALGTITTGTWNATAIAVNHGGTGIEQYTTGDILYASASTTLSKLAKGEVGQILISASNAPAWNGSILVDTTNNIVKIAPNLNDNTTLQIGTQNMAITNNTNLRHLYGKFTIYTVGGFLYAGIGTATGDSLRYIWFNDDSLTGKPVISTSFKYNPKTKTIRIGGPSSSTVDGDDNSIIELYRGDSSKTNWLISNAAGTFTLKDNHNGSAVLSTYVRTVLSFAHNSALSITGTGSNGTISSTSTLYLKAASSAAASLIFYGWNASLSTPAQGEIARFNSSGKFIVGTPSSPNDITELLYVSGNVLFAYNSTTDTEPVLKLKDGTGYMRKLIGIYAGSVIMGMLAYNGGGSGNTISKSQWLFREFAPQETAANATTGKYENYLLPSATAGLAANISYDILTTKLFTNTANYDNKYLVLTSSGTNDSVVFSTALLLDDNSVQKMPRLTSGTELNTLVPGVYFVPTAAIATGLSHSPLATMPSGGILINLGSYSNTNNTYRFLIFRGSATGLLWIRHLNNTTNWDAWRRIATLTAEDTQFDINSGYTSFNGYNLRIYNASATTDNYTASIQLCVKDTTTGKVESGFIQEYSSHGSGGNGGHLTLSSNNSVEIFSGEGAIRVKNLKFIAQNEGEAIYLVSDSSIVLLANAGSDTFTGDSPVCNRKGLLLTSTGEALHPVNVNPTDLLTTTSNPYGTSLGTSAVPWSATYTGGYYLYHTASGESAVTLQGSMIVSTSGVAGTQGITALTLGNSKSASEGNNSQGRVTLYGTDANYTHIQTTANSTSGNRTFYIPAYAGAMYAAHINTSAVGTTKRPVYCTSTGRITVCSYLLWASVGTAAADIVANQLIYSSSATKIQASGHYASTTKIAINSNTEPSYNFLVKGSTSLLPTTAASDALLSSGLIIDSSVNASSGSTGIELYRGASGTTKASWQIINDAGVLKIRNNYTTAAQATYTQNGLVMDYNTGNTAFAGNVAIATTTCYTDYALLVNGVGRFNNIVYFANGTSYYINSSGRANLAGVTSNAVYYYNGGTSTSNREAFRAYANSDTDSWWFILRNNTPGTTSAEGFTELLIGNAKNSSTAWNASGKICLYNSSGGSNWIEGKYDTLDGNAYNCISITNIKSTNIFASGSIKVLRDAGADTGFAAKNTDTQLSCSFIIGSGKENHGVYSSGYYNSSTSTYTANAKWMIYRNNAGTIIVNGNCTGNADTATRINGNLDAITTNTNCNIWVSSTASADGIPKYISGVYINPSTGIITSKGWNGGAFYSGGGSSTTGSNENEKFENALKAYWTSASIGSTSSLKSKQLALGLSIGGFGVAMGYFLDGTSYNTQSKAYGGFFLAHYSTPRYIGISNGTWACRLLWKAGDSVTGAVWNDYAEYRTSSETEPGRVVMEKGDDTLIKTEKRLSHFAGVISDTWGFSQGETETAKTPIAVSGRVLVYPYKDKNEYKPGDCVCAAPNGTVDIMSRDEAMMYPDRIVGTVSCVPDYDTWGGGNDREPIKVNNRIWIKVK